MTGGSLVCAGLIGGILAWTGGSLVCAGLIVQTREIAVVGLLVTLAAVATLYFL